MPKPIKTYRVTAELTISVSTVVKATSKADAKRKAAQRATQSFCHQCASGEDHREWVTSGELDGEPQNLDAEEEP